MDLPAKNVEFSRKHRNKLRETDVYIGVKTMREVNTTMAILSGILGLATSLLHTVLGTVLGLVGGIGIL